MTDYPYNKYGQYSVPENLDHRPAVRMIKDGDVYEPKTIAFMRDHAGDGDIVHAGTFFGDFLPGLSSGMAQGAKIWAFEPNPNSFQHAQETIRINGLQNVELTNAAVSDRDGEILFKTVDGKGRPMGGHSHFVESPGPGVETVKAIRLDDVIPDDRHISILQLDVEGHERAAMGGALAHIRRCKPILILEEFNHPRWIKVNLSGLEYRQVTRLHGNKVYATQDL